MNSARRFVRKLVRPPEERPAFETLMINQGRILTKLNEQTEIKNISEAEFKVFSQWGEDGIIQHIVGKIPDIKKTFIEFGVENFSESNCRFLMMKDGWSGMVIDGSQNHIDHIRSRDYYWHFNLNATCAFITKDNICDLLESSGFAKDCGILSVDIDGVDYHVLEALSDWQPSLLITEFNAIFGSKSAVTVPYDPTFVRHAKHYSGLYWGASLAAFDHIAKLRGYALVGVNSTGSNAFFVRRDQLWAKSAELTVEDAFRPVAFRDARNESGELTYLSEEDRVQLIGELPLVDVTSGRTISVKEARGDL
jgi:hypothetical protein